MVNKYEDLTIIQSMLLDNIEFIVYKEDSICINAKYKQKYLMAKDEMKDFRKNFKKLYNISYMGHIFTLFANPATYNLLNEWLVYDINEVYSVASTTTLHFDPPHIVVFDMDSTLITDEEDVRIRDEAIYEALDELKKLNCVLCLWSYGDRKHVVHSLEQVNLNGYFDIILSEGRNINEYNLSESDDTRYNVVYKSTPFYLDVNEEDSIPKSPRVVLWYLQKYNIVFFKTITLVDDLYENNISYDNFVHLKTCPVPVKDWHIWNKEIVQFISNYDNKYNKNANLSGRR